MTDWYENRHKLRYGQVFIARDGSKVMLDSRVPGDGTQWYVADWVNGSWGFYHDTIEPGDLYLLIKENGDD